MVKSFTDIVKKTCTFCKLDISAKLSCKKSCDIGNLKRVIEYVLTEAGTVFKFTEKLDNFGMNTVDTCIDESMFACLFDCSFNLTCSLIKHFFDSGGMDSAVGNKLFKCETCNLSTNGIKA